MAKYRRKPIVVRAFKFGCEIMPEWFGDEIEKTIGVSTDGDNMMCTIETPEGVMIGHTGDYIIKGVKGEIYPCKPDVFRETYEEVT